MRKPVVILAVAASLGLITSIAIYQYVAEKGLEVERARLQVERIVVARQNIPIGRTLAAEDLRVVDWPADAQPEGAARDAKALVGMVARSPFVENEPVLESKLASPG